MNSPSEKQLHFDDIELNDVIPELVVTPDETQLFFFSAVTNNGHRIHYDQAFATLVEGHANVVVHGPLQIALQIRAITDWMGGSGKLRKFAAQNRASAYPGEELTFGAIVTAKYTESDLGIIELKTECLRGGEVLMPGSAVVSLPRRGSA
jgi:hydroxyacyl-ACP dehydratase HTD2-like protein with hotdog domain